MTDERKKQLMIGGAIFVAALVLLLFFRGGSKPVTTSEIDPALDTTGMLTPGLITPPTGGGYTTVNLPPYVPPTAPGPITISTGPTPQIPFAQSPCPCPKVCDTAPLYFSDEMALLNSNPVQLSGWYSNVVPQVQSAPAQTQSTGLPFGLALDYSSTAGLANSLRYAQNALPNIITAMRNGLASAIGFG